MPNYNYFDRWRRHDGCGAATGIREVDGTRKHRRTVEADSPLPYDRPPLNYGPSEGWQAHESIWREVRWGGPRRFILDAAARQLDARINA